MWGAATSSYQVEGNNTNSDWWPWEKAVGHEHSGLACRHYELYEQDFDLAQNLHHNAHRLSIEWARIEPVEGQFSEKELKHYIDVILALKKRDIEPVVTLHHFTNPIWFSESGGWEHRSSIKRFLRYSDFVVRALSQHVRYWITINEPTIYVSHSYLFGWWPPQKKSCWKAKLAQDHMIDGHIHAYRLIHNIYKKSEIKPLVAISHHMPAVMTCTPNLKNRLAVYLRDRWFNFDILDKIARHKAMDFIGLNYYSRHMVELKKWGMGNFVWDVCQSTHHPVKKNSLGWDIYPEGLLQVLLKLKRYDVPVMITENGICTLDDNLRWEFLSDHLKSIHLAIEQGVPLIGYLHWSLLDNFEWDKGFKPRFGLIEVDYKTHQRTVKDSAKKLAEICRTGFLEG